MAKTSRIGIGKIGAAVIVVVMIVMVVGIGGFFGSQGPPVTSSIQATVSKSQTSSSASPTSQSSSLSSTTQTTCTAGGTVTVNVGQSGPPCGCQLVDSDASGSLYVSPNAKVGDNVCAEASLKNTSEVSMTITNSSGSVVFSATCAASGGAGPATGDTCTAFWNTANPDPQGNAITAGTYHLVSGDLEANFTLS